MKTVRDKIERIDELVYMPLGDIPDDMLDAAILSIEVEKYLRVNDVTDPDLRALYTSAYLNKSARIALEESKIDIGLPLYLFTWSPDPKQLPDGPFEIQHRYNVEFLSKFLQSCFSGCICVEATQRGNPHYHGWYQSTWNPIKERARIVYVKVMQDQGLLKITESIGKFKIDSYNRHANCLYYYKKDLLQSMLSTSYNPIYKEIVPPEMPEYMSMFFKKPGERVTAEQLIERTTKRAQLAEFYGDPQYGL